MEINGIRRGQRVRVTSLQAVRGWQDRHLVTLPAGQQSDGIVEALTSDGFFELKQDGGAVQPFNVHDTSISVKRLPAEA